MADLKCSRCGREATYADAAIADRQQTCEKRIETVVSGQVRTFTTGAKHDWKEQW